MDIIGIAIFLGNTHRKASYAFQVVIGRLRAKSNAVHQPLRSRPLLSVDYIIGVSVRAEVEINIKRNPRREETDEAFAAVSPLRAFRDVMGLV